MKQLLKNAVKRIKDNLREQEDSEIKLGLYMALQTLKNEIEINDEEMLEELGLNEELEKYL